jgi:hypothetical protein
VPSWSKVAIRSAGGTNFGLAWSGGFLHEGDNGLLGRAIVPGRQRISLGIGLGMGASELRTSRAPSARMRAKLIRLPQGSDFIA